MSIRNKIRVFFKGNMHDDEWEDVVGYFVAGCVCVAILSFALFVVHPFAPETITWTMIVEWFNE